MLRSCCRPLERFIGRWSGDGLLWQSELKPHASGDYSIAVVQANSCLEDQSQVFTSPSATYVGVYDGHGGPEASRFVNKHLFPYMHSEPLFLTLLCVFCLFLLFFSLLILFELMGCFWILENFWDLVDFGLFFSLVLIV